MRLLVKRDGCRVQLVQTLVYINEYRIYTRLPNEGIHIRVFAMSKVI